MVPIKTQFANRANYGGTRSLNNIRWIVIHYTGNDGDSAGNNGLYFSRNVVKASAHYFVDSGSIVRSVPDNHIAWSVGGNKYPSCGTTGGGKYHGQCTNTNSISIELCDDAKNGTIYPSAATIANAVELTELLMRQYNIPRENVIRHFDVVGKLCPAYWCGDAAKNKKWKSEFLDKVGAEITEAKRIIQREAGLSDATIAYLAAYQYGDDLLRKLAAAMM